MASPSVTAPTVTAAPGSVEQLIADEHAQVRAHLLHRRRPRDGIRRDEQLRHTTSSSPTVEPSHGSKDVSERTTSEKAAAVVVGVDGSAGAKEALRWALAEARLRKAPLRLVHAWTHGYMGAAGEGYGYMAGVGDMHGWAEELLNQVIGEVAGEARDVDIERLVIEGGAAAALLGAVAASDLLVVGTRGHGGFAGLLLGSVSQQCVHHAPCPVVVVHTPTTASAHGLAYVVKAESDVSA